nr:SusC/RagA family TonB-linked outer membrane protein [Mangrovibacterium diazotrophicum]
MGWLPGEEFTYDWQSGYRRNFVNNTQRVLNLGDAATMENDGGNYDLGLRSYFGRINYVYDEKYLFEANVRRDASSRFAKGNQWGTFPSLSAGWIISKENFMSSLRWLNSLKLRASWGQLGNENIGTGRMYTASDILASGINYSFGGDLYSGVAVKDLTNKELTWETSQQLNFGVDLTLANGFEMTADYFDKKTKDLLWPQGIPLTMQKNQPYVNNGEVQNKGVEASFTYRKTFSNDMKFRATFNASHIVNKITKMSPEDIKSPKAKIVGYAINSFYGYKMDGIYQVDDFNYDGSTYTLKEGVTSVTNYTAQPGDIKFKDLNGDGVVDANNDRTVIGKQYPDLTYSLNLSLEWKRFDFSAFFQGVAGIEGYLYYEIASPFSGVANMGSWWKNRWTPENPSNTLPRLILDETRTNIHSSFYMEDASYLRLKNIELGYTFNSRLVSKVGLSSVRVYGNIQNAFTITNFKGFDPEQNTSQTRAEAFPQVQVMTVGLNVNF